MTQYSSWCLHWDQSSVNAWRLKWGNLSAHCRWVKNRCLLWCGCDLVIDVMATCHFVLSQTSLAWNLGCSGKISSWKRLLSIGKGCPGEWWSPHPWRYSRKDWMWCSGLDDKVGIDHSLVLVGKDLPDHQHDSVVVFYEGSLLLPAVVLWLAVPGDLPCSSDSCRCPWGFSSCLFQEVKFTVLRLGWKNESKSNIIHNLEWVLLNSWAFWWKHLHVPRRQALSK